MLVQTSMLCRWSAEVVMRLHLHLPTRLRRMKLSITCLALTTVASASSTIEEFSGVHLTLMIGCPMLRLSLIWRRLHDLRREIVRSSISIVLRAERRESIHCRRWSLVGGALIGGREARWGHRPPRDPDLWDRDLFLVHAPAVEMAHVEQLGVIDP